MIFLNKTSENRDLIFYKLSVVKRQRRYISVVRSCVRLFVRAFLRSFGRAFVRWWMDERTRIVEGAQTEATVRWCTGRWRGGGCPAPQRPRPAPASPCNLASHPVQPISARSHLDARVLRWIIPRSPLARVSGRSWWVCRLHKRKVSLHACCTSRVTGSAEPTA